MDDFNAGPGLDHPHDERIARVVWAAHILAYLTKKRLLQLDEAGDTTDSDSDTEPDKEIDHETGYQTERAGVLSSPRDSVGRKFLDCVCQLLSPSKGWDSVTAAAMHEGEDGVIVNVARNDAFLLKEGHYSTETFRYFRDLEEYLAACGEGTQRVSFRSWSLAKFQVGY
jgi:hypothetical protein